MDLEYVYQDDNNHGYLLKFEGNTIPLTTEEGDELAKAISRKAEAIETIKRAREYDFILYLEASDRVFELKEALELDVDLDRHIQIARDLRYARNRLDNLEARYCAVEWAYYVLTGDTKILRRHHFEKTEDGKWKKK